ncbi:MAG TPA: rod shape-determining protein RodA [Candidatus Dormibacteraeota bacterium]|nr:rod shape-determining protein RodA [Candidatus Dormibacteraeota bacterium]
MDRPWYRSYNFAFAGICVLITLVGILFIHSATLHDPAAASEAKKQSLYLIVGIVVMAGFSALDYHYWKKWAPYLYALNLILLGIVLAKGESALGAQRWISVGPLGTFQPSEFAKFFMAVSLAAMLSENRSYGKLRDLVNPLFALAFPALLIVKQPDLGTTLVLGAIFTAQLFFGLDNLRVFALYVGGVVAAAAFTVGTPFVLKPFQRARLLVFLNPNADPQGAGWNLNQSKIAVGDGQLLGRGLFHGSQTQLNFVPEHSRDFIFTVLAEESGFIGAMLLLAGYALVLWGGIAAVASARDKFGVLLGVGLVTMFAFHIMVNVGMTVGIMPITGIPLPFMSFGGSALLTDFMAIGVLLNIYLQRHRLVF